MDHPNLKVAIDGGVAILTLNDPAALNAANTGMTSALTAAFERIASGDLAVRAVVLTGEGRAFCSGANLSASGSLTSAEGPRDVGDTLRDVYNPLVNAMRDLPCPIVAAVNGPAVGIGCAFALAADLIVAGESAYFLQAFRRIGLVPDGGATWLLSHSAGRARAMELMLLGEKLPAPKALEWGLINRVVPDDQVQAAAFALARELAAGPTRALGLIRRAAWAASGADLETALVTERRLQTEAGQTRDFQEGVRAFFEKRPAKFTGA